MNMYVQCSSYLKDAIRSCRILGVNPSKSSMIITTGIRLTSQANLISATINDIISITFTVPTACSRNKLLYIAIII